MTPAAPDEHDRAATEVDATGGCTCRFVRYRLRGVPMIVHCCHCTWCQRETGTAFALNAMIESDRVDLLDGEPDIIDTPSASGTGQRIARCPRCRVAVWSNYGGRDDVRFVRVGTLDRPERHPPDVHIFTSTKQPWVVLPSHMPAFEEYYEADQVWGPESLLRRQAVLAKRGG